MATTKRQKRSSAGVPTTRIAAEPAPPAGELHEQVVLLAAGTTPDQPSINEAPTLTLPVVAPEPAPEPSQPAPESAQAVPAPSMHTTLVEPVPFSSSTPPTPAPAPPATPALSPADERASFMRRRMVALAGLLVFAVLVAFLAYSFFAPQTAATPAAPPVAVSAPQAPAAAPAVPPVAVDAPQAPAAAPVAPAGAVIAGCDAVAGLPVFTGATCIKHKQDEDNGQVKIKNTYSVNVAADDVRRFYEGAFAQGGWNVTETKQDLKDGQWDYTVEQGARKLELKIEAQAAAQGNLTEFQIEEK